jgi:peptidoglycan/LPS O-acetylase OafA/YrhL
MAYAMVLAVFVSDSLRLQIGSITNFTASFSPDELSIVLSFFIITPILVGMSSFRFFSNALFKKICYWLGAITYPLYLIHWKIGESVISSFGVQYGKVGVVSVTVAFGIFALAAFLAVLDHHMRAKLRAVLLSKYAKN